MQNHKACPLFGERLKARRVALRMSHKTLAMKCRIGAQQLKEMEEKPERGTNIRVLAMMCRALDCSADWLLGLHDVPPAPVIHETEDPGEDEHAPVVGPW